MLRFSVGAVQGLPLAHVFSAFFINPLKYSAAEAAVRLQAKSLRSEGASVQGKPVSGQDNGFYGTIANQTWRRNING